MPVKLRDCDNHFCFQFGLFVRLLRVYHLIIIFLSFVYQCLSSDYHRLIICLFTFIRNTIAFTNLQEVLSDLFWK